MGVSKDESRILGGTAIIVGPRGRRQRSNENPLALLAWNIPPALSSFWSTSAMGPRAGRLCQVPIKRYGRTTPWFECQEGLLVTGSSERAPYPESRVRQSRGSEKTGIVRLASCLLSGPPLLEPDQGEKEEAGSLETDRNT